MATATLYGVNIDCPDAEALAKFYAELSGMPLNDWGGGYFSIGEKEGFQILFQQVEDFQAPTWPSQERGQQMHLDFQVEDVEKAVAAAEKLGATQADEQPGESYRVMLDPAGHPFCLCGPS